MNKNFAKIPENAESKAVDREKEEYPVQQVAVTYPIGAVSYTHLTLPTT